MDGVQINTKTQVIDLDGKPIAGLYAAGEVDGGVPGAVRLESCSVADCLVFGRIAGKSDAAGAALTTTHERTGIRINPGVLTGILCTIDCAQKTSIPVSKIQKFPVPV